VSGQGEGGDAPGGRFAGRLLDQALFRGPAHDQRAAPVACAADGHPHHGRVEAVGSGRHDADYLRIGGSPLRQPCASARRCGSRPNRSQAAGGERSGLAHASALYHLLRPQWNLRQSDVDIWHPVVLQELLHGSPGFPLITCGPSTTSRIARASFVPGSRRSISIYGMTPMEPGRK
jgi:hypothetical protein